MTSLRIDETFRVSPDTPKASRRLVRGAIAVLIAVAGLLYLEWRLTRNAPPPAERAADTMCVAARIGLPCRD